MKPRNIVRGIFILAAAGLGLAAAGDGVARVAPAPTLERPAICLAPGTPPERIAEINRLYARPIPDNGFQFGDFDGWDLTATNPCCRNAGDPVTIRWSIVPDGTALPSGANEPAATSNLRAFLNGIYGSQGVWLPLFTGVFNDWGARTGATYIYEPNDDGAPHPGSGGVIGVRGDVRIGGHLIDGNFGILAYNYFPNTGDMVIDTGDSFYAFDAANNASLGFRNMLAHEHGHGLGISHVCPIEETKLMEPFISFAFDGPQHDDTLGANRGYGDDREPNDTSGAAANLGSLPNGVTAVNNVSVDDNSDIDFYKFTVPVGRRIDVTLAPVGFNYLQGPQTQACNTGAAFNSLAQSDLTLQVVGTDGSTVLATANNTGAGGSEALNDVILGAAGTFFVRVTGTADAAQLYGLSLNIENIPTTIVVNDVSVPEQSGPATFTVGLTQAAGNTITVQFATAPSSATAPADYTHITGTVTFLPGETAKPVNVTIIDDITDEPNETFFVNLSSPSGAIISDAQGVGTIVDNDPNADVSVTKTDGVTSASPGQVLVYTIVVANAGPNDVTGVTVVDTIPPGLNSATWTCSAGAGASCQSANGAGNINQSVNLNAGSSLTYTLTATVDTPNPESIRNQVTATVPGPFGEPNLANNTAVDDDFLLCNANRMLVPDGRITNDSLGAGGTRWYVIFLRELSSYSVEVKNLTGSAGTPTVTIYPGADGCAGATPATVQDTTAVNPQAGLANRWSFLTTSNADTRYRVKVVNPTGGTLTYSLNVGETTVLSPSWSTNGTFNTYYSLQNTTNGTVAGTLTLRNTTGVVVGSQAVSIAPGTTFATNTAAVGAPPSTTGTAELRHDGPPGAISMHAATANFNFTPAYVQVISNVVAREKR